MCASSHGCESETCNCQHNGPKIKGFLIPCLLLLLKSEAAHGYQLIEKLSGLDYFKEMPDAGVIYRHLRKLEQEQMIESTLEAGGGGPARKVYSLTEKGRDCLYTWRAGFKNLKKSVDSILKEMEKIS